jgi:hypothetical protein
MPFNFLSFKNLQDNIRTLLSNTRSALRPDQQKRLDDLIADLDKLNTSAADLQSHLILEFKYNEKLDFYNQKLEKLSKIPRLDPLQFDIKQELVRDSEILQRLSAELQAKNIRTQTINEESAMILSGLIIILQKEIEYDYSGRVNKFIGFFKNNLPSNNAFYAGSNAGIGNTTDNLLDLISAEKAINAYAKHTTKRKNLLSDLNVAMPELITNNSNDNNSDMTNTNIKVNDTVKIKRVLNHVATVEKKSNIKLGRARDATQKEIAHYARTVKKLKTPRDLEIELLNASLFPSKNNLINPNNKNTAVDFMQVKNIDDKNNMIDLAPEKNIDRPRLK